jgi:hypothetical protein
MAPDSEVKSRASTRCGRGGVQTNSEDGSGTCSTDRTTPE